MSFFSQEFLRQLFDPVQIPAVRMQPAEAPPTWRMSWCLFPAGFLQSAACLTEWMPPGYCYFSGICGFTDISRMSFLALSHKLSKICRQTRNFAMPVLLACCSSLSPPTQIYFSVLYELLEVRFASPNSGFLQAKHRYLL